MYKIKLKEIFKKNQGICPICYDYHIHWLNQLYGEEYQCLTCFSILTRNSDVVRVTDEYFYKYIEDKLMCEKKEDVFLYVKRTLEQAAREIFKQNSEDMKKDLWLEIGKVGVKR